MYTLLAIHHPVPERFDAALAAMEAILNTVECTTGLHEGYIGYNASRTQVIALTTWDDKESLETVFPTVQEAVDRSGIREWLAKPSRVVIYQDDSRTAYSGQS